MWSRCINVVRVSCIVSVSANECVFVIRLATILILHPPILQVVGLACCCSYKQALQSAFFLRWLQWVASEGLRCKSLLWSARSCSHHCEYSDALSWICKLIATMSAPMHECTFVALAFVTFIKSYVHGLFALCSISRLIKSYVHGWFALCSIASRPQCQSIIKTWLGNVPEGHNEEMVKQDCTISTTAQSHESASPPQHDHYSIKSYQ